MNDLTLALVVAACGLGTFVIRLWPMLWHKNSEPDALGPRMHRALSALGPAAIAALLVASLWPQMAVAQPLWPALRMLAALAVIAVVRQLMRGVAIPTLAGVLAYGLLQWAAT